MNFFNRATVAARYQAGRPFFHPLVIERVKEVVAIGEPFHRALDVGCGTGLSAIALRKIVQEVIAVDISSEMLRFAPALDGVRYVRASAECLPFQSEVFDLMTLSQSIHWFRRDLFFEGARRLLSQGGWLVVYDNYFSRRGDSNPEFLDWHRNVYHKRYPSPAREWASFDDENAKRDGFQLILHERLENKIAFTPQKLFSYLLSQSNVAARAEFGSESIVDVRRSFESQTDSIFKGAEEMAFNFELPVWFLKKLD